MGTIAEKSDYLIETKDKIKESINNLGGSITSETTFREYAEELDTIYSSLPKVTGENTEVTLTPTLKGKLGIVEKGNSTQESTNGYNLVNYDNTQVTLIKSTSRTTTITPDNFPITLEAGTYTISLPDLVMSNNNYGIGIQLIKSAVPHINVSFALNKNYESFTINEAVIINRLYIYLNTNDNDNATATFSKIMLEKGSTAHNWEQYTGGNPAPNPSYPFPIKSVTGNNNVVVRTANLVNYNETSINLAQGGTRATNITPTNFPLTLQAGTYTLNYDDLVTTNTTNGLYTTLVTTTGNVDIPKTSSGKTTTFTLAEEKTINIIYVYVANADTGATATFSKIMLNTGSTALPYQPYSIQTLPLNLGTIELNKIGNYQDYIYKNNDNWYKHNAVRKLELAIANMNNNENYPGWTGQTQILTDLSITSSNKDFDTSFALCNIRNGSNMCVCNTGGALYLQRGAYGNDHTQTYWKTNYANLIFTLYYGILAEHQFDIEITDTQLIEQLNEIEKMKSYNGTTIITSTNEGTCDIIIRASALKGE